MTAPLQSAYKAIPAEVFLRARFLPLVNTTPPEAAIGSLMWTTGLPKPYRAVKRITGARDLYTDYPVMRAHTFGSTYEQAANEAGRNDENIQLLVEFPGWATTLPSGLVVHCAWAEISEAAHEEPYAAESVVTRFVSEYRFALSLIPA